MFKARKLKKKPEGIDSDKSNNKGMFKAINQPKLFKNEDKEQFVRFTNIKFGLVNYKLDLHLNLRKKFQISKFLKYISS